MVSYTVTFGPPSNPAQQDDTAEATEAATPFESWIDWLEEARDAIDQGDGDPDDADTLLALVLEHIVGGGPDAVALKEKRAEEVLREAQDSTRKIATALRQQREARETRKIESAALAGRLDRMTDAIGSLTRENAALRSSLSACEVNLTQATALLEREIAKERSLRRLLDAQRARPHTQRIASELAKRHAAKCLEVAVKSSSKEEAA
jgi:hypothetical protein